MTSSPNAAARAPSTTRWSNVSAMLPDAADGELAVAHDRPVGDAPHAEDRHLGMVHDRRLEEAGELARARHAEGRAAQLLGGERPGAGALGQPAHVGVQLVDAARVAAAHDRHDEPGVGLHREAEVVAVEVDDRVAVEARVQLGELAQRQRRTP